MPGFKKRRNHRPGPSKNEQKLIRARNAESQARNLGNMGAQFPSIKQMRIKLTFLDVLGNVLEETNQTLGPSDSAQFTVDCPGRCGSGSFNFVKKITETIAARLPFSESGAKCTEPIYAGAKEACGVEIKCRMEIDYFPLPAPEKISEDSAGATAP
jgi:hypothetical protein